MPRRALIGPWGHNDPVHGVPGAGGRARSASACAGATAGSRASTNGIDDEPMLVAWLQDSVPPARPLRRAARALGRRGELAARRAAPRCALAARRRARVLEPRRRARARCSTSRGAQTIGLDGGAWCADGHSDDLPLDQRADDGRSLCFDSAAARGAARAARARAGASSTLVSDRPLALVERAALRAAARRRVAARDARPAQPHATARATTASSRSCRASRSRCASRWTRSATASPPGSRLRVALSPTYWPLAWPSPEAVTLGRRRRRELDRAAAARRGDGARARPRCARPRSRRPTR